MACKSEVTVMIVLAHAYKYPLSVGPLRKHETSLPRFDKHVGHCPACDQQGISTSFVVRVKESTCANGRRETSLAVSFSRDFGRLRASDESAWLISTVKPRELTYMARIWREWRSISGNFGTSGSNHLTNPKTQQGHQPQHCQSTRSYPRQRPAGTLRAPQTNRLRA